VGLTGRIAGKTNSKKEARTLEKSDIQNEEGGGKLLNGFADSEEGAEKWKTLQIGSNTEERGNGTGGVLTYLKR